MKRFLKRFALVVFILFGVLLAAAVITATLFEKQVGRRILSELNNQLATELTVESFDLTAISTFPNVAANLRGIVLMDTQGGVLLEADRVGFNIGLLSFLTSEYKVKSIVVSDGALNIHIDRDGNPNYRVTKGGESSEPGAEAEKPSGISVSLEEARLEDIELVYSDDRSRQAVLAAVQKASFSGQFSSSAFDLRSEAQLKSSFAEFDGIRYLVGKQVGYDAEIAVNMEKGVYEFKDVLLDVESNEFKVEGIVEEGEATTHVDLFVTSEESNLEAVIQLLPQEYLSYLGDFSSSGQFSFHAGIKGESSERENPEIRAELKLEDGRLKSPRLTNDLKDVSFTAVFTNGRNHNNGSSVFEIENLKGYFNRELIEFMLRVENFDDPGINFLLDGTVPISAVYRFLAEGLENERIQGGFGEIEIQRLELDGRYRDMINTSRINRVKANGQLVFDDAGINVDGKKVTIDRGAMLLQGNQLSIKDVKIELPDSEIEFDGSAFNVIPVLFADSTNTQRAELEFAAEMYSEKLDIDELMALSPYAQEKEEATTKEEVDSLQTRQIEARERITNFLKGTFNARIDAFNYGKIEGRDFTGQLDFDNNELLIRGSTRAMEGVVQLEGRLFFERQPRLEAQLVCEAIDVKEFFRQTNDFGQEVLQSKHVSGTLNTKMTIDAFWDQQGNFLNDKLRVLAGIGINEGELKEFKLLESFSTFVKIKDLQHIRFVNLQNFLEVRNRILYIPVMFIQSNALNLAISGEHNFDNQFRYDVKVNAGQVLINRFKNYDPTLQPKPAKRSGFFNLHYLIEGNIEDYDFQKAKREVKADFVRSLQRKRNIQIALENAFGVMDLIEEPEEWRDIDSPDDETEYLDFELEGNSNN
jgi:hypothetical protein